MKNTALEFLKIQIKFNNNVVTENCKGITNEEAMIFPNGNVNCANWVLGHLIFVRNALIRVLGGNAVWEDNVYSFYNRGAKPLEHVNEFVPFNSLWSYYLETQKELDRILAQSDEQESTNIEDLAGLSLHEIYHSGQLGTLRRLLGKEGAIK